MNNVEYHQFRTYRDSVGKLMWIVHKDSHYPFEVLMDSNTIMRQGLERAMTMVAEIKLYGRPKARPKHPDLRKKRSWQHLATHSLPVLLE